MTPPSTGLPMALILGVLLVLCIVTSNYLRDRSSGSEEAADSLAGVIVTTMVLLLTIAAVPAMMN